MGEFITALSDLPPYIWMWSGVSAMFLFWVRSILPQIGVRGISPQKFKKKSFSPALRSFLNYGMWLFCIGGIIIASMSLIVEINKSYTRINIRNQISVITSGTYSISINNKIIKSDGSKQFVSELMALYCIEVNHSSPERKYAVVISSTEGNIKLILKADSDSRFNWWVYWVNDPDRDPKGIKVGKVSSKFLEEYMIIEIVEELKREKESSQKTEKIVTQNKISE